MQKVFKCFNYGGVYGSGTSFATSTLPPPPSAGDGSLLFILFTDKFLQFMCKIRIVAPRRKRVRDRE
jgi:hypothetical protein